MINQSDAKGLKGFSKAVLTAVIALILAVAFFATTSFAGLANQYNVEIVIDSNDAVVITTNETEPIEILAQANITLADTDKLDITAFAAGEGGTIKIDKANSINVEFNGVINTYTLYEDTVGEALNSLGITVSPTDKMNYELADTVKDGMVISIMSAKSVTLNADGKSVKYAIYQGTVADLLSLAQITLGENDYSEPALDTELKENMVVTVYRVEFENLTETNVLPFKTVTQNDSTLTTGTKKVATEGTQGEEEISYEIKYVNGKEISKTEISRKTVKEPVDKVINVGTKKVTADNSTVKPNGVTSKNGYTVGQKITGKYTHYCACAKCNGNSRGITSSGKRITNGMENPYYVACNWLPLGTVISVDGINYTVVDRGGSGLSKVGRVDIFTPEGHAACYQYGTGSCSIEIIRLGW